MDLLGSSAIVETAIGLALVFFLGAGVCTGVVEAIASVFGLRAKLLWRTVDVWFKSNVTPDRAWSVWRALRLLLPGIRTRRVGTEHTTSRQQFFDALPGVIDDPAVLRRAKGVNRDAAVSAMAALAESLVAAAETASAAPANAAGAAADALATTAAGSPEAAEAAADAVLPPDPPPPSFGTTELGKVLARMNTALGNASTTAKERAEWAGRVFDAEMEQLGAIYRSRVRWFAAFVAVLVVGLLGLDAIDMATELYKEPDRRRVLVAAAEAEVADPEGETCTQRAVGDRLTCARDLVEDIEGFQVGRWAPHHFDWDRDVPPRWGERWIALLGMGISVAAFTAGAPWWFSVLKKLMDVRKGATATT